MSNFNVSNAATINNVTTAFSDLVALSLPDLKKDVITAHHAATQFSGRGLYQTTNSYAARFPASLTMTSSYHTPGTRLLGNSTPPPRNFRDVYLDDRLVSHIFMDELDSSARSIIPFQNIFGQEMGHAIGQPDDINCAIIAVLAARASATVSGGPTGTQITKADCNVNVGALMAAMWDMKNGMDEKNVSGLNRTLILRPAQYNLLLAATDRIIHRDLGQGGSIGGNPVIPPFAGFSNIEMSNNIPSTNISSSATGTRNTYAGDFTKTVGVAFAPGAFGTVTSTAGLAMGGGQTPTPVGPGQTGAQLMPINVKPIEMPDAFGTLYVSSLIIGHGILDPLKAGEIKLP